MPSEKIVVETESELKQLREKLDKVKVVVFNDFGKHPLTNILELPYRERNIIKGRIEEVFNTISDEELTEKFNTICLDTLLTNTSKIEDYPVYNRYYKSDEEIENNKISDVLYDASGNLIIV